MSDGYFCSKLVHERGYIDLLQQPELEKEQVKDLCSFMSVGLGGRQRYRARQLEKAILNKHKERITTLMRPLALNKGFLKRMLKLLEESGLPLERQIQLSKTLKRLMLDFLQDRHTLLSIKPSELQSLPIDVRNFVIALIVLKAEIANLHRLDMERDFMKIREMSFNRPDVTKLSREPYRGVDRYKEFSTGVSLTCGDYSGIREDIARENKKSGRYVKDGKQQKNRRSYDNKKTFYRAWNKENGKDNNVIVKNKE